MSDVRRPETFEGSQTAGDNQSILNEVWNNTANDCLSKVLMPETKTTTPPDLSGMHYIDCTPILGYDCSAIGREAAGLMRSISLVGPDRTTASPLLTLTRSESTAGRPGAPTARPDAAPVRTAETTAVRPTEVAPRPATPAARPAETAPIRPEAPVVRAEATTTRPTDRTVSEAPIRTTTPRGDTGLRYRTRDARGSGTNEVDIDHLGVVRSLATTDSSGRRISISGDRLAALLSDTPARPGDTSSTGWRVSRSGSGDSATTTVTAPDGRTNYTLDSHGRLTGDVGSHRITPPVGVIPVPMGPGSRFDSTGASGEIRSARRDVEGRLEGISIRTLADSYREIKPESWKGLKPDETRDLGDGWSATRGYFHGIHYDGTRISHTDGTTYIVSPEGRLVYANNPIEAASAERERPERATAERRTLSSFADEGTRYSTADRRGTGTNHIDVDRLGIVRAFAHTSTGAGTRTLSMEQVDRIPAGGLPHSLPNGWTASRTGTGSEVVTTVVAPDGATTYRIDSTGALIRGRSSVEIPTYNSVVTTETDRGGRRIDTVMSDGRIASGHVTADGILSHLVLKDRAGATTTMTREQWERSYNDHLTNGELGGNWRIMPAESPSFPSGSRMIIHNDGTVYFIGPKGAILNTIASFPASRERYRPI